jgi:hypothetical protein
MGTEICEPNIDVQEEKKKKRTKMRRKKRKRNKKKKKRDKKAIMISYRTLSSNMSRELARDCKDEKNEVVLTVMQNKL